MGDITGASHLKNNANFIEQAWRKQSNEHPHRSLSEGRKLYLMKTRHVCATMAMLSYLFGYYKKKYINTLYAKNKPIYHAQINK